MGEAVMNMVADIKSYHQAMKRHLEEGLLPFWIAQAWTRSTAAI